MNTQQLQAKLEQMKGRTFLYAKISHDVTSYIINETEGMFVLITDKNRFPRKFESAKDFLSYWIPVETSLSVPATIESNEGSPQLPVELEKENSLADSMIDILKDNIERIRKDAKYIPQAKAINENVNSMIQLQRLKLDTAREISKHSKR